ncbi:MAG TPA: GerMN domain-containing protein [Stenomitos sp.]
MATRPSRLVPLAVLALLLIVGGALGAWWLQPKRVERAVTLYYLDPQGMYLVPVTERLSLPGSRKAALQAALKELIDEVPPGLMAAVPPGSQVEVHGLSDGKAEVSLKIADGALGSGGEQMLAGALVRTAATAEAIQEVKLSLMDSKGGPWQSEHLDLTHPLTTTDPGMENLYLSEGSGLTVTVYYRLPNSDYLVPLSIPLPPKRQNEPLKGSFALLRQGPPSDLQTFLVPSLDPRTDLRWNGVEGDVAQVLWKNAPEATPSELAIRATVLTLTETGRIKAVQFKREGAPLSVKVGPFDLSQPIRRPDAVNTLPDKVSLAPGFAA